MKNPTIIRKLPIALAVILSWPLIAWVAARALVVNSDLMQADALVVLGGSSTYLERTQQAAQLFRQGRFPVIVLTNDNIQSGWSAAQQRNPLFVELAVDELVRHGVPANQIEVVPGAVNSTHDEALRLRDYSSQRQFRSLMIVTSAYQSRRALWTFARVFSGRNIRVGVSPAATGEQSPSPATWWWHGRGWKLVPAEYAKIIYYRINY
jgi:uncharacterized SAM-binding protein YcdF (DUF218 family)